MIHGTMLVHLQRLRISRRMTRGVTHIKMPTELLVMEGKVEVQSLVLRREGPCQNLGQVNDKKSYAFTEVYEV